MYNKTLVFSISDEFYRLESLHMPSQETLECGFTLKAKV